MNDFKEWLIRCGFKIAPNPFQDMMNTCDWYAYRRSDIPARECETNDGRPAQIVAYPSAFVLSDRQHEVVEIELCGEANGVWWKLRAYSLSTDEAKARLPAIEASLIAAWNALYQPPN